MKKVFITGASRGIGKEIKKLLELNGYACIAPSKSELNLQDIDSINNYFKQCDTDFYAIVNCAGINILGDLESIQNHEIDLMLDINLKSPLYIIKSIIEKMKQAKDGKIVNISSIWGIKSKEYRTLYSMTKFGLNGMTRSLARELGEYNILINSVAPGYVKTDMTDKNISNEEQDIIKDQIPLKRFAQAEEIAKLVLFLISENNTYITGETISIDGGFLA
jgi:3-oxoacyl-[acyl-carrier protein] reductase